MALGDNERRLRSGLYTGLGGGAYTGPDHPLSRNWPPIPILIADMGVMGLHDLASVFRPVHEL